MRISSNWFFQSEKAYFQVQMGPMGTTVYNDSQHRNRNISGSKIQQHNEVFEFPDEYQAPQSLGLQLNFKNQNSVSWKFFKIFFRKNFKNYLFLWKIS